MPKVEGGGVPKVEGGGCLCVAAILQGVVYMY